MIWFRPLTRLLTFCLSIAAPAFAQQAAESSPAQTTSVHGMVRVASSASPLPHALVRINGDATTAVLTDGDGRFEIPDVPVGPQEFTIMKPGYLDEIEAREDSPAWNAHGYGHNVIVASEMGDVEFTMQPVNSIVGQVQLSTGDAAEGIQVMLLRRTVQDGRAAWQIAATARTSSEGMYRFGDLTDGLFMVYTEPAMDNEGAPGLVEKGRGDKVARQGYALTFYPDARDASGAARIHLAGGGQVQANISLMLEPFHAVSASVAMPGRPYGNEVSVQVLDAHGHQLPYPAQYDSATHTAQAALPDGTYGFRAMLMLPNTFHIDAETGDLAGAQAVRGPAPISGQVGFAVAGHAVSNLRLPMAAVGSSPVQVSVSHTSDATAQRTEPRIYIGLTNADEWATDNITYGFAEGKPSELPQNVHPPAGSYWVHTAIGPNLLCEASFTAGGVTLGHDPLLINDSGTSAAPLTLALRDDCAKLTLTLPGSIGMSAGIERYFTVYVVPDFDTTVDLVPQTLRLSTGGRITLSGLTPGGYHVYTFDHPVALEYRNPAVLQALPSQAITLAPNADAQLAVEVAQP